ncbi:MAG: hypothetical protein WCS27_18025, partial [Victivallaceae bacterium]
THPAKPAKVIMVNTTAPFLNLNKRRVIKATEAEANKPDNKPKRVTPPLRPFLIGICVLIETGGLLLNLPKSLAIVSLKASAIAAEKTRRPEIVPEVK